MLHLQFIIRSCYTTNSEYILEGPFLINSTAIVLVKSNLIVT